MKPFNTLVSMEKGVDLTIWQVSDYWQSVLSQYAY